jgi:phage-related minor tail protein
MATDIMRLGLIISATDKTGGGINSAIGKIGKLAGALGLAGVAYMGFDAIKKYDDAVQSLSAVTGVTGKGLDDMKSQVMSLAKESKKSGDEVAKAFENIGSNMSQYLSDPKALKTIASAGITLSKAARMETGPALDNLTTIMNQFNLEAKDAAKSVNILTAGEIVGNVRTLEQVQKAQM